MRKKDSGTTEKEKEGQIEQHISRKDRITFISKIVGQYAAKQWARQPGPQAGRGEYLGQIPRRAFLRKERAQRGGRGLVGSMRNTQ